MVRCELPRAVVAGLAGDSGKSFVTIGLARALSNRGIRVAPFKKGPDFIDAAWLGAAAKAPGRNLDTFLMSQSAIHGSLGRVAGTSDLALVEGNRGLFDGLDAAGSHSTAQLARVIDAPIFLVVSAAKVTRTVAAQVLGCLALEKDVPLAGVVLNRVATSRQEKVIRDALSAVTALPVVGAIPRIEQELLPSRRLGLTCAVEHPSSETAIETLAAIATKYLDLDAIVAIARRAPSLASAPAGAPARAPRRARIGVLRDAAFSFYYPENLEALEAQGGEIVPISPLADESLPAIDALYAGGGFPEEHAEALVANRAFRRSLGAAVDAGLPVWAECGGLMVLGQTLISAGREHPMVGALPVRTEVSRRPHGHGYVEAHVDRTNPFLPVGSRLVGHEFHYSRIVSQGDVETAIAVDRGVGVGHGRDGLAIRNVVACYTHLHALGCPEWAPGLVAAACGRTMPRVETREVHA